MPFENREHAARLLADKMGRYRGKNPLILGIPRGGVVMAAVIAKALEGEVDVVLVTSSARRASRSSPSAPWTRRDASTSATPRTVSASAQLRRAGDAPPARRDAPGGAHSTSPVRPPISCPGAESP